MLVCGAPLRRFPSLLPGLIPYTFSNPPLAPWVRILRPLELRIARNLLYTNREMSKKSAGGRTRSAAGERYGKEAAARADSGRGDQSDVALPANWRSSFAVVSWGRRTLLILGRSGGMIPSATVNGVIP